MSEERLVVLDSSVGVKWFKPEEGSQAALQLLDAHRRGEVRIVVADHFVTELVAVAVRRGGGRMGLEVFDALRLADLTAVALDDRVATHALKWCAATGGSFYDALPAALASLLHATLYSADARAHGGVPGVELV